MKGTEIVRRVNILKALRSNVEAMWNDIDRFGAPLRLGNMYQRDMTEQMVTWQRDEIYDSTAIWASQTLAANIHGVITNPSFKWYDYLFMGRILNQDPMARSWIQDCTEISYENLYNSNFDPEISSFFQDLVQAGNGVMVEEVEKEDPLDWQGVNFSCIPVKEFFFERDHRGNLYRAYRWLEWTAVEIKSKWRDALKPLPPEIAACLDEGGDPTKKFTVIFGIYFREDKAKNLGSMQTLADSERPFGSKYALHISGDELGDEGGYYDMPAVHVPYEKTSGSMWGHSPMMVMIPTIKYINAWMEMQDMSVRKMVDPPMLVRQRGLLSDLNLKPGQYTLVSDVERDIKPLITNGRIDFSQMTLKELRDMVRAAFHVDELQLRESPQMSATEAQIRYELMNRVLGPTMGRVQNGGLDPLLMRHFMALLRNKQFPPMPDIVLEKRAQFKVHYSGPLVRAQKMDEVAGMERYMAQIGAIGKVMPKIMNVINPEKYARTLADKLNTAHEFLRTPSEVAQIEKQQDAAQAQAMQGKVQQEVGKGQQEMAAGQQAQNDQPPQQ